MATHSSVLAWKNPVDKEAWKATVHGVCLESLDFFSTKFEISVKWFSPLGPQPLRALGCMIIKVLAKWDCSVFIQEVTPKHLCVSKTVPQIRNTAKDKAQSFSSWKF